jgi:NADPH:quinone reductase-like Zn-dependent oxidoreductase
MFSLSLKKAMNKFPMAQFTAEANTKDLETLASLVRDSKIRVHIEKTYSYLEIPEAIKHIEAMTTKGKVAMIWDSVQGTESSESRAFGKQSVG